MMEVTQFSEGELMQEIFTSKLGGLGWILTSDSGGYSAAEIDDSVNPACEVGECPKFEKFCLIRETNGGMDGSSLVMCDDVSQRQIYGFFNEQITEEADEENEVPPHTLDHIYAKKPRDPGTEPVKPVRRRSRKKEMITNQYVIQEMIQHDGPRINIIRQPLPGLNGYKPVVSRPKIAKTPTLPSLKGETKWKRKEPTVKKDMESMLPTLFDECDVPQLGALVTISDTECQTPVLKSPPSPSPGVLRRSYPKPLPASAYVELPISADTDLDNLEDEEETEFFFDFPMDDEPEPLEDIDFCELSLTHAMNTASFDASPHSAQSPQKSAILDSSIHRSSSITADYVESEEAYRDLDIDENNYILLPKSESDLYVKLTSLREDLCFDDVISPADEVSSPQKIMKFMETSKLNNEGQTSKITPQQTSPIRRSSRPSRTPSRLVSDDMILSPPKRSYRRFKF